VRLRISSGRLSIDQDARVTQIDCTVGENGEEKIVLTIGLKRETVPKKLANLARRIKIVELR
jgi:hypothetical protein